MALILQFGFYGGLFGVAVVFLLLASSAQNWQRLVLCAVSWLLVLAQSSFWVLIMAVASLAHSSNAAESLHSLEIVYWPGIVLGVVITAGWSYRLLRKPTRTHQHLPVVDDYRGPKCVACGEPVEAGI